MNELKVRPPRGLVTGGVLCLLAVIFLQMFLLARANSATWDEADHTYAAYMQWHAGDFGLNPEHPPLVKFLAALPLLGMSLKLPAMDPERTYRLQEVIGGREFLFGNDANRMLFRARMAASILTLLLAVIVFVMARKMFGTAAGLVALGLIAFDPTLLGHSALVTTDAGQACFMLWAIYALYRYVAVPSAWRLVVVGLVVGLALAAKHSAVLLLPVIFLLLCVEAWRGRREPGGDVRRNVARFAGAFAVICVLALVVLWSFYGFRYAARGGGLGLNPSLGVELQRVPSPVEGAVLGGFARLHLLPESYVFGFAHVLSQAKIFPSFLLGRIYPHPVWFYFPVAMPIKSTLTLLVLLVVMVWALLTGKVENRRPFLYLLLLPVLYMVSAMVGGGNIGIRYLLPVYVFWAVAIGGAAAGLMRRDRRWMWVVLGLLVFQAVSVARAFPAYVAYANEAFGGPKEVHAYLSDSSVDWGQQLKSVKRYLDARGVKDCWFAYFGDGVAEPSYYGIPCKPLITADSLYFGVPHEMPAAVDGPVLMSAGVLSGFEFGPAPLNAYEQFKAVKPTAVIDYGVFVFDGHFEIPLAAALSHVQRAGVLLGAKRVAEAEAEARLAVQLAPDSARVNAAMGQVSEAAGRGAEARVYEEKALSLAESVQPEFQQGLIRQMRQALGR